MPAKRENGPAASTRAVLIRQSNASSVAPGGAMAISVVMPPPFFHGIRRIVSGSSSFIADNTSKGWRAACATLRARATSHGRPRP